MQVASSSEFGLVAGAFNGQIKWIVTHAITGRMAAVAVVQNGIVEYVR